MFHPSIRRKIVGIAIGLVILMVITSALSMVMSSTAAHLLDELTRRYIPAYGHLAQMNVRSLERAVAVRRMVLARTQSPPDTAGYDAGLKQFEALGPEIEREAQAARQLIQEIIDDPSTPSDNAALGRIDSRIEMAAADMRHHLDEETATLLARLAADDTAEVRRALMRIDALRDEFNGRIDAVRSEMMAQVYASATNVMRNQRRTIAVSAAVTALAAAVGLTFAVLVAGGITRPVRRLLEGTREVEAGRLDRTIDVTTRDEIGQLSAAFNRMVEKLRRNEKLRETFGRYIDPQVVDGLIEQPAMAAAEGQRRVVTALFCDMKGFTTLSEGVTPQGLVRLMNRYFSTMSAPVRGRRGIIDKYIGDAIMAYWGPPFVPDTEQAPSACLAALEMIGKVDTLRRELPELLGLRSMAIDCDVRIGLATGEALVGSIGSEFMMSYTVMGHTVNLASRLEGANKVYGTRILASEATVEAAAAVVEVREIDRIVLAGHSQPETVYEIMAAAGGLTPAQEALRASYGEGLKALRRRDWDAARAAFRAALTAVPGDGPAAVMMARVDRHAAQPPDGRDDVERLEIK